MQNFFIAIKHMLTFPLETASPKPRVFVTGSTNRKNHSDLSFRFMQINSRVA